MGSNYRPQPSRNSGGAANLTRIADRYFELKSEIHRKLIGVLNLERVSSVPKDRVRAEIGRVVERLLEDERVPMTTAEQNKIIEEVLDEVLGLGPLEPLLKEPSISDILVNGYNKVYIERNGRLAHRGRAAAGWLARERHNFAAHARWPLAQHPPLRTACHYLR